MRTVLYIVVAILVIVGIYYAFMAIGSTGENNITKNTTGSAYNNLIDDKGDQLKVEILKQGTGLEAKSGDTVKTDYVGTLESGQKFDSSIDRGQPFSFTLGAGEVIKGWDLGILGMKVGEKRKLVIPPSLAYGSEGIPGFIPGNSSLIFEVELLAINEKAK